MSDYNQYFIFDEKFVKKYSPFPGFSFDSPLEQIHINDGPLNSVTQLNEFMEAFLTMVEDHGLKEHAKELLYFSTLIPRVEREINSSKAFKNSKIKRQKFLEKLRAFPLDFEFRGTGNERHVWFEEDEQGSDDLKQLYVLSEKKIIKDKSVSRLRAKAYEKNYYYDAKTGESIKPDHRQIEISRHIEITIKSTLNDKLSVVVPDLMLNEKAISAIIGAIYKDGYKSKPLTFTSNTGRPPEEIRSILATVSRYLIKYISENNLIKKPKTGLVSNQQALFLFKYFALFGWLEKKENHNDELKKNKHKNQFERQLGAFERTYRISFDNKFNMQNYIREIIQSNKFSQSFVNQYGI